MSISVTDLATTTTCSSSHPALGNIKRRLEAYGKKPTSCANFVADLEQLDSFGVDGDKYVLSGAAITGSFRRTIDVVNANKPEGVSEAYIESGEISNMVTNGTLDNPYRGARILKIVPANFWKANRVYDRTIWEYLHFTNLSEEEQLEQFYSFQKQFQAINPGGRLYIAHPQEIMDSILDDALNDVPNDDTYTLNWGFHRHPRPRVGGKKVENGITVPGGGSRRVCVYSGDRRPEVMWGGGTSANPRGGLVLLAGIA